MNITAPNDGGSHLFSTKAVPFIYYIYPVATVGNWPAATQVIWAEFQSIADLANYGNAED